MSDIYEVLPIFRNPGCLKRRGNLYYPGVNCFYFLSLKSLYLIFFWGGGGMSKLKNFFVENFKKQNDSEIYDTFLILPPNL